MFLRPAAVFAAVLLGPAGSLVGLLVFTEFGIADLDVGELTGAVVGVVPQPAAYRIVIVRCSSPCIPARS